MALSQLTLNGLSQGSLYGLTALGVALYARVLRYYNFADAATLVLAPFAALALQKWTGCPFFLALPIALVIAGLTACMLYLGIFAQLRKVTHSPLIPLVCSIGLYIIVQNSLSWVFGDATASIRPWHLDKSWHVLGVVASRMQLVAIAASGCAVIAVPLLLKRTALGLQVRCIADDSALALSTGIRVNAILLAVSLMSAVTIGASGLILALDVDFAPTTGMNAFLMGLIACAIGSESGIVGAWFAGIALGLLQNILVWRISSEWKDPLAFIALITVLLVVQIRDCFIRHSTVGT